MKKAARGELAVRVMNKSWRKKVVLYSIVNKFTLKLADFERSRIIKWQDFLEQTE